MWSDEVYYKLYLGNDNLVTVLTMQWFDERDYNQTRFVKSSSGAVHFFTDEKDAVDKLNKWYEPHQIDPEYRALDTAFLTRE